jgi:archaellin
VENSATRIILTLGPVAGGSSVDVSQINITYRDKISSYNVPFGPIGSAPVFSVTTPAGVPLVKNILVQGGLAVFTVLPTAGFTTPYWTFGLEIKPPTGGVLLIERTTPAKIDIVTDLK